MPWDDRAFEQLRDEVLASLGGAHSTTGVPFFLYPYPPTEERRAVDKFEQLAVVLRGKGHHVQMVYLGRLLASVLRSGSMQLYLGDAGKTAEKTSRAELQRELSRTDGLPKKVADALLEGVPAVCEPMAGGSQNRCAVLLRAGALFPFVHVSQILNQLEQKTRWTVVVAFPGRTAPGNGEALRFLDETEGSYYRARVIHSR
jgi:hypothetical protein